MERIGAASATLTLRVRRDDIRADGRRDDDDQPRRVQRADGMRRRSTEQSR